MTSNLFNQPFVHCGICHRLSDREDPLYLTSCAHTLCSQHMNDKICPVCHIDNILVIKLTESKQFPEEIKMLFQPIPSILENLHNISQFQITGMISQCNYYKEVCEKLSAKCSRQRQLLFQAKQELDSVAYLKKRISELESQLSSIQVVPVPPSSPQFSEIKHVDLTLEDNKQGESFIRKLKNTNSLRNKRHTVDLSASDNNNSCSISNIMAESTQLDMDLAGKRKKSSDLSQFSNNLPDALNKLRIVKRNHTFNNTSKETSASRGNRRTASHRLSSKSRDDSTHAQTQTNVLMRRNTTSRASEGSRPHGHNKSRRIR